MGPYTLSQNGERLAESGIYWYFTQTIKSLNFMNFENLGFCFQTSGLELHPTFSQGSEAQGSFIVLQNHAYMVMINMSSHYEGWPFKFQVPK